MSLGKKYQHFFKNNKLDLSYNGLINQNEVYDIINDEKLKENANAALENRNLFNPFLELIQEFENITKLQNVTDLNIMEYLYLNRYRIHNILYDNDTNINIDPNMMQKFSDYYYLNLLIKEQQEIINYKYDYKVIKKAYDSTNVDNKSIKKIILSKMLLSFISNYEEGLEQEQNQYEEELLNMKNKCIENIAQNKKDLEKYKIDLDLNNLENDVSIVDIYINIIIYLIKNDKLNQSNETMEILNELDIKNLRLNKDIFDALSEALDKKYLSKYQILEYNDFYNVDKLNFYYILFDYILKSSDYVFHIPFLLETRQTILKIIKENGDDFRSQLKKGKNNPNIDSLKKVLGYFIEKDVYCDTTKKGGKIFTTKKNENKSKQSKDSDSNVKGSSSNNSNVSNSNNINNSESKSNSNAFDSSISSYKAFDNSSFKQKDNNQASFNLYGISGQGQDQLKTELAYLILSNSEFIIEIQYNNTKKETTFLYKKCTYKKQDNQKEEITIENIKDVSPDNEELDSYYKKFITYLEAVEEEIKKSYKNEKKIEMRMKFIMGEKYNVECRFEIKEDIKGEKEFRDENMLNTNNNQNYQGLSTLISVLNSIQH